eukprot:CAMPEP_0115002696 /NCGR_PEP_ID=MMETSP0216-20121206/18162_1 /TAXON_ID=223996 /ORGANISM="Protocruzia adherens, Strain Boccale" /LENGTH=713 /DNA_ID=CAMNT_0002368345 /DNA_START=144 /DNA_END=2285 /DNA_ORIENTATION=-
MIGEDTGSENNDALLTNRNGSQTGEETKLIINRVDTNGDSTPKNRSVASAKVGDASQVMKRPSMRRNEQTKDSLLKRIVESHYFDTFIMACIICYAIIIFVILALEEAYDEDDSESESIEKTFLIVEIFFLSIFITEIGLRIIFEGKKYLQNTWNLFDIFIILLCVAFAIVQLFQSGIGILRRLALLRLLRIVVMFRKINEFRRLKEIKALKASLNEGVTSALEKVLIILRYMKDWVNDDLIKEELNWCIQLISSDQLYEPVVRGDELDQQEDGEGGNKEAATWIEGYSRGKKKGVSGGLHHKSKTIKPGLRSMNTLGFSDEIQKYLEKFATSPEFDVLKFAEMTKGQSLTVLSGYIFSRDDLLAALGIDQTTLALFMKTVQDGYQANPYHNSTHATDVLQTVYSVLRGNKVDELCHTSDLDNTSLVVSAAIHDLDHNGKNNLFHVNMRTPLAIRYNDKSVLENHHIAKAFEYMADTAMNIFENLTVPEFSAMRETIIKMVLSTDMKKHFKYLAKFRARCEADDYDPQGKDKSSALSFILHCADISNPTKPWHLCFEWSQRVLLEFFLQGDIERDNGLPISQLCDRSTVVIPKSQVGFIDFIITPTFEALKLMVPDISETLLKNLKANREKWNDIAQDSSPYPNEMKRIESTYTTTADSPSQGLNDSLKTERTDGTRSPAKNTNEKKKKMKHSESDDENDDLELITGVVETTA